MSDTTDSHDVRDESSISKTTRRGVLAALGLGGVAALGSSSAEAQSVGGSDADEAAEFLSRLYAGPESDIPAPVQGRTRYWYVTSGGGQYAQGDLLIEGNSSWSKLDLGVESLNTPDLNNAKYPDPADNVPGIRDAIDQDGVTLVLRPGRYEVEDGSFNPPRIPIGYDDVTIIMQAGAEIFVPDGITETDKGIRLIHLGGDDATPGWNGSNAYNDFSLIGNGGVINGNYQNQGNISNTYDGHNIQLQGSNFVVRGIRSINATGDGIEPIARGSITDTQDYLITGNIFSQCFEQDIHPHGGINGEIANNICRGEVNNSAINFYTHKVNNEQLSVHHNYFVGSQLNGAALNAGSQGQMLIDVSFSDNWVVNNSQEGIYVKADTTRGLEIARNKVIGNGSSGISLSGANYVDVESNRILRNGQSGIYCGGASPVKHLNIKNNTIRNNSQGSNDYAAIQLLGNGSSYDHVSIHNEDIVSDTTISGVSDKHGWGIFFKEADSSTTYSNIRVTDCRIDGVINTPVFDGWPTDTVVYERNPGYSTSDDGSVTISSGTTSSSVSYSVDASVSKSDVFVSPVGNWIGAAASSWEVRSASGGSFDLVVDADPGQDVEFSWHIDV